MLSLAVGKIQKETCYTKNMQNMCVPSLTLSCKGLPLHEPKLASFMVKHVAFLSKSPKISGYINKVWGSNLWLNVLHFFQSGQKFWLNTLVING